METFFASADRADPEKLSLDIEFASKNPVIDGLLNIVGGLLAVINEQRQIIALNDMLLNELGIGDSGAVLGLRLGEAVGCVHAHDMPGGCGTSKYCITCGAAIAQVTSLDVNRPVEKACAVVVQRNGRKEDLFFKLRVCPITHHTQRLLLLFIQDMTQHKKLAVLERAFFHDISNVISGLLNAGELLTIAENDPNRELIQYIQNLSFRLANDVAMQKCLYQNEICHYQCIKKPVSLPQLVSETGALFSHHPAAKTKRLDLPQQIPDIMINTDSSLVLRVLGNMVTNAFEATDRGGTVKITLDVSDQTVTFGVWNAKSIPTNMTERIFQRNISTKPEMGRGVGTYAMKLFGESVLGGQVDFTSSENEGTLFRFRLSR